MVLRVDDLEALRQAGFAPVNSQQTVCQAVKGADPEVTRRESQQALDSVAHLPGRLVGEGHRKEMLGHDVLDQDQPGDAMHEHTSLAASGPGEHQDGLSGRRGHRLPLRVVQRIENCGDVHIESREMGLGRLAVIATEPLR